MTGKVGRPPKPDKKIQYGTRLSVDVVRWLSKQKNAAAIIDAACRELMEAKK